LYEIKIQHLDGTNFALEEYYDDGPSCLLSVSKG